jgi:hypothetical protein
MYGDEQYTTNGKSSSSAFTLHVALNNGLKHKTQMLVDTPLLVAIFVQFVIRAAAYLAY